MSDKLEIIGLQVTTHIGVHAWEQRILQQLLLDLHIPIDCSSCQEDLSKTIDYDALTQGIRTWISSQSFQLIETVAAQLAQWIKDTYHVQNVTLSVTKPHAIKQAQAVRVTVQR